MMNDKLFESWKKFSKDAAWLLAENAKSAITINTVPIANEMIRIIIMDELKKWTYKPGFSFELTPLDIYSFQLTIRAKVPNTYNPAETVEIVSYSPLYPESFFGPDGFNSRAFGRYLLDAIMFFEKHEAREWLRRDGEIFDNPHKSL